MQKERACTSSRGWARIRAEMQQVCYLFKESGAEEKLRGSGGTARAAEIFTFACGRVGVG